MKVFFSLARINFEVNIAFNLMIGALKILYILLTIKGIRTVLKETTLLFSSQLSIQIPVIKKDFTCTRERLQNIKSYLLLQECFLNHGVFLVFSISTSSSSISVWPLWCMTSPSLNKQTKRFNLLLILSFSAFCISADFFNIPKKISSISTIFKSLRDIHI